MSEAHKAAMRGFIQAKAEQGDREGILEIFRAFKIPNSFKGRLFDLHENSGSRLGFGIFRELFPNFPFVVAALPVEKLKDLTGLHQIYGTKGATLVATYFKHRDNASGILDSRCFVLMVKLPYLKGWMALHEAGGDLLYGPQFRLPSERGYHLTLESMDSLADRFSSPVERYLQNAVVDSY